MLQVTSMWAVVVRQATTSVLPVCWLAVSHSFSLICIGATWPGTNTLVPMGRDTSVFLRHALRGGASPSAKSQTTMTQGVVLWCPPWWLWALARWWIQGQEHRSCWEGQATCCLRQGTSLSWPAYRRRALQTWTSLTICWMTWTT